MKHNVLCSLLFATSFIFVFSADNFSNKNSAEVAEGAAAFLQNIIGDGNPSEILEEGAAAVSRGLVKGVGNAMNEFDPEAHREQIAGAVRVIGEAVAPEAGDIAGSVAKNVFEGIGDAGEEAGGAAHNVIEGILKGAGDGLEGGLKDFGKGMENGIPEAMKGFGDGVEKGLPKAMEDIGKGVHEGVPKMLNEAGKGMNEAFKEGAEFRVGLQEMGNAFGELGRLVFVDNFKTTVYYSLGLFGGYYTFKHGIPFALNRIDRMLNRPKLILESSSKGIKQRIVELIYGAPQVKRVSIFDAHIEERLNLIVEKTRIINYKIVKKKQTTLQYRNLLLYGLPGTGKTMFAKELARLSGMEWAFVSAGAFNGFNDDADAIKALDELFDWAERGKGLLVFIDEADSLLGDRTKMNQNSKEYKLLDHFLTRSGEGSNKYMFVFATNHKDGIDTAVKSRIQDYVHVPLPGFESRLKQLHLYKGLILDNKRLNGKYFIESVQEILKDDKMAEIANYLDGYSGREISALVRDIKAEVDATIKGVLTEETLERALKNSRERHDEI